MIYTYKYLTHPIEEFHKRLMFFFEKLFELEPAVYEDTLTEEDFRGCVNDSPDVLKEGLKNIVQLYCELSPEEKQAFKNAYRANSDIKLICEDVALEPVKYNQLNFLFKNIFINGKEKEICFLKEFLMKLWKGYPHVNRIKEQYGTVQDHFNKLRKLEENRAKVCPFCGLNPLLPPTKTSTKKNRDAYDHIAAESLYPFVSVNFKNLAPACDKCNTNEKKAIDIFYKEGHRRPVLYPYDETYNPDELTLTIETDTPYNPVTLKTLFQNIDWTFAIKKAEIEEPYLQTWDEVYHIKDRYESHLKMYEKEWFSQLEGCYNDEMKDNITYERFKEKILKQVKRRIKTSAGGMLQYVYYNHLLSLKALQEYLENR